MKPQLFTFLIVLLLLGCENSKTTQSSEVTETTKNTINPLTRESVLNVMKKTSEWQMNHLDITMTFPSGTIEPLTTHNWVRGTFLSGMMSYYKLTKDEAIFNAVNKLCKDTNYELGERLRNADEFTIGKVYADIYLKTKDKAVIANMTSRIDDIIKNPSRGPVVGWDKEKNWNWCDALFMAPPAWAKLYTCTGDIKYLEGMDVRFWDTADMLYSKQDSLFYRDIRYMWDKEGNGRKTANGKKIMWSRGNGWVLGGLTEILDNMPNDFHSRPKYEQLFKEMAIKIASLQGEDGMWRASLLDFHQYPAKEFSGSAFFCYAMAWGINNNLLDKKTYWPIIEKSWSGLVSCVQEDGKIGFVQRVGASPDSVKEEDTMEYGAGAFLMAGKEIYNILNEK